MGSDLNKEIDESIEQYSKQSNKIVPGTSVAEFNSIIGSLMVTLNLKFYIILE